MPSGNGGSVVEAEWPLDDDRPENVQADSARTPSGILPESDAPRACGHVRARPQASPASRPDPLLNSHRHHHPEAYRDPEVDGKRGEPEGETRPVGDDDGADHLAVRAVLHALRARGVDDAERLLEFGSPEQIMLACERWDQRSGVRPGLLVSWIRKGDFAEPIAPSAPRRSSKDAQQRARFDQIAARHPEGSAARPHAGLRWRDDCPGLMIVVMVSYPVIELECDKCGAECAVTPRCLDLLNQPAQWPTQAKGE
jgi:hypothetical protein